MGGGGQGCHFEAAFGVRLMRALGSRYHYNALAQELTGIFWASGRLTGKQYLFPVTDEHNSDMILATGWNGMQSHQIPRAPLVLREFSKSPDKLLVVIDPRKSETAAIADIHLAIRPGTDALLTRAMIAIILKEGWHNKDYIEQHVSGFAEIEPWFRDFDAEAAVKVCELDYDQVREVCRLFATRKSCLHCDLGIYMNRHSTATSYLHLVLLTICGRVCMTGGNIIPGQLMPIGAHSDERNPKTWRTVATGFPALMGVFPPNVMPEEIMSDHPEHLRAVLCCQANPLRSFADTTAYEKAFGRLDLLVTGEIAMTETAALSHYVLPTKSAYESWDGTFFPWTFPEVYFQTCATRRGMKASAPARWPSIPKMRQALKFRTDRRSGSSPRPERSPSKRS
jgi:anaerobic selenocysteine-containing dehydrogenase